MFCGPLTIEASSQCRQSLSIEDVLQVDGSNISSMGFVVRRGLSAALESFGDVLAQDLMHLNERGHILELGAGQYRIPREIYNPKILKSRDFARAPQLEMYLKQLPAAKKPLYTAVSFRASEPVPFELHRGRIRTVNGRLFEKIPRPLLLGPFGLVNIALDLVGVMSYTDAPDVVLQRAFDVLRDDGSLYLEWQTLSYTRFYGRGSPEEGWNPEQWLRRRVQGITVQGLEYNGIYEDRLYRYHSMRIQKIPGQVIRIPQVRVRTMDWRDLPPYREFEETGRYLTVHYP